MAPKSKSGKNEPSKAESLAQPPPNLPPDSCEPEAKDKSLEPKEPEKSLDESPEEDEDSPENCECCQLLHEEAVPIVNFVNVSKSDVIYDRTLCLYKLESSSKSSPDDSGASSTNAQSSSTNKSAAYPPIVFAKVKRQLDRFEENKIWELIGLTPKMYGKLPAELRKVTSKRLVFRKCAYRLHNTRHFQLPLVKKGAVTKENVLKQNYEDDRKLLKKNQAFDCPWNECPHSFQDPQDMRIHYMFDHESIKLFCCGKRFENYDSYLEHYVTTMNGEGHSTWMARECWGCGVRYTDAPTFYVHAERCDAQINPFPCPDPLCGIRFEVLTDTVDHFYLWHDPAGAIVCKEIVYPTRESIQEDLQLLDDGQLVVNYPLKAVYTCQLCHIQFTTDRYYHEHVTNHVQNPHLWLVPTILFCVGCHQKNCRYQRIKLLELLPKVIAAARRITVEDCTKNPVFLIWRLYLSKEFIETMEMALMKLVSEHKRLEKEEEFLDQTGHPECEDKRLAYILNSLYFLYTVPYKSDQQIIAEKGFVFPQIVPSEEETQVSATK